MATRIIATELQLDKIQAPGDHKVKNAPGLIVRVSKQAKSFRWDRGSGHTPRVITYGRHPSMTLQQAREAHAAAKDQHRRGVFTLAAETGEAEERLDTVADLASAFYRDRIGPKRKNAAEARRTLDVDILRLIGDARLDQVTTPLCRQVVQAKVRAGSLAQAARILQLLKQMFRYAVSVGAMDSNPAQSLEADLIGAETRRRSRHLGADEIARVWQKIDDHHNLAVATCMKLLLVLGLRSSELREARWDEIDWDARTLTIPVARQKLTLKAAETAQPFVVPLPELAIELLQPLRGMDRTYIFPGKSGPFSYALMMRVAKRISAELGIEIFKPHDLRRTMRTGLSRLKVPMHIAERCLNHSLGKIIDTYDIFDYLPERREAVDRWADYVQRTVGLDTGNVV